MDVVHFSADTWSIHGLGRSSTSQYYAIKSLDEATAFLQDPYLGGNLLEICHALLVLDTNNATEVFTDTVMGGDTDPRVFYRTLYTCPKCGGEVSFTENDFLRHSGNTVSKYGDAFKGATIKKFHSFLEFECPGCQCKTRVNYLEENGGKSPVIYIDSVLIE